MPQHIRPSGTAALTAAGLVAFAVAASAMSCRHNLRPPRLQVSFGQDPRGVHVEIANRSAHWGLDTPAGLGKRYPRLAVYAGDEERPLHIYETAERQPDGGYRTTEWGFGPILPGERKQIDLLPEHERVTRVEVVIRDHRAWRRVVVLPYRPHAPQP